MWLVLFTRHLHLLLQKQKQETMIPHKVSIYLWMLFICILGDKNNAKKFKLFDSCKDIES